MKTWRLSALLGFLSLLYVALGWRLYVVQVQNGDHYLSRAQAREASGVFTADRARIFFTDREGNQIPAALNKTFSIAYAVPTDITHPRLAAEAVASVMGDMDVDKLTAAFQKSDDPYEPLGGKLPDEVVQKMSKLDVEGIYMKDEVFRFYPFADLASHVLGFVGPSDEVDHAVGRYGIESLKNEELQNKRDIQLTIDRNVQAQAERILSELAERYRISGGSIIIQEPETGKILAMGNYPSFNPNVYSEATVDRFLNPAVQSLYEPGSVFKPITMAIGIDTESITPETTYYDSGELNLNGYTIKNWDLEAYGHTTMTEVIERSINTGAAFAQKQVGREPFYEYLVDFGFDAATGIELPGEVVGNLRNLVDHPRDVNYATASFGQGVAVTPIELISAFSAIANDGILMRPYILESTGPQARRRVISREAAAQVTDMMISAVTKAHVAAIPNYTVAGKTGTAQIPGRGGYTDQFIHTFVGYAPASDPQFVALIKLDKPRGVTLAGYTVVPAFRELAEFLINYYQIPPDNIEIESEP